MAGLNRGRFSQVGFGALYSWPEDTAQMFNRVTSVLQRKLPTKTSLLSWITSFLFIISRGYN